MPWELLFVVRMPHYIFGPKSDLNLENCPYGALRAAGVLSVFLCACPFGGPAACLLLATWQAVLLVQFWVSGLGHRV